MTAARIRSILLATDLSRASDAATAQAIELARDLAAELLVMCAIDQRPGRSELGSRRIDQIRSGLEAAAQGVVARGRERGVPVRFLIWEGPPGEAIVDVAWSEQVDLVIVGSHGRGTVGRFLIGSVSDHVVRYAPCPVLVVRATSRSAPEARPLQAASRQA